jgi:predicted tellurium resistance membrane protein TerC
MPAALRDVPLGPLPVKTWTVYAGGVLGIVAMRFVAGYFLRLLERFPALARAAYYLVAWIGAKLLGSGIHAALRPVAGPSWRDAVPAALRSFPFEMSEFVFWGGMATILLAGLLIGRRVESTRGLVAPGV